MLADEDAAVDGYDIVVRHGSLERHAGHDVFHRLAVDGEYYCSVDNQKIGVGGREPMAVIRVVDGVGKRQFYEMIRLAVGSAESLKVSAHKGELVVVAVGGIGAAGVENNIARRRKAREEIADITGYSSASHLSRQFKAVTGLTPTQFVSARGERTSLDKV